MGAESWQLNWLLRWQQVENKECDQTIHFHTMHMGSFALWQSKQGFIHTCALAYVVAHISQTLAGRLEDHLMASELWDLLFD